MACCIANISSHVASPFVGVVPERACNKNMRLAMLLEVGRSIWYDCIVCAPTQYNMLSCLEWQKYEKKVSCDVPEFLKKRKPYVSDVYHCFIYKRVKLLSCLC